MSPIDLRGLYQKAGVAMPNSGFETSIGLHLTTPPKILTEALDFLGHRKFDLIIDAGAGYGDVSIRFSEKYPESKIIGIEFDPKLVSDARSIVLQAQSAGHLKPNQVVIEEKNFLIDCNHIFSKADLVFYFAQGGDGRALAEVLASNMKPGSAILEVGFMSQLAKPFATKMSELGRRMKIINDPNHRYIRLIECR